MTCNDQGIVACVFLVAVTSTFRVLYVFVLIEHRSRRLIYCNVTAHPTAASHAADVSGKKWRRREEAQYCK
jgi:hypothetical protein